MLLILYFSIFMLNVVNVFTFEQLGTNKEKLNFATTEPYFNNFIRTHNKNYEDEVEYMQRHDIFVDNLMYINKLNENGDKNYGITEFTDMTHDEFIRAHTCFSSRQDIYSSAEHESYSISSEVPDEFSWVKKGYVSPVKNQRSCGTCWVFSAIGSIEGQVAIKHGRMINLSEQQVVDCVGDGDCNHGGSPQEAIDGLALMGGVMKEEDYPYASKKNKCHADMNKAVAKVINGTTRLIRNAENLKKLLYHYGPVSIEMFVLEDFKHFKGSGIYVPRLNCNIHYPNHAILLVGYGHVNGVPYWLIKNSWGTTWGDKGFGKIIRGSNACQAEDVATTVVVQ